MIISRDFRCDRCGTVEEHRLSNLVPFEYSWQHPRCTGRFRPELSPTPTTFKFADTSARKGRQ